MGVTHKENRHSVLREGHASICLYQKQLDDPILFELSPTGGFLKAKLERNSREQKGVSCEKGRLAVREV